MLKVSHCYVIYTIDNIFKYINNTQLKIYLPIYKEKKLDKR